jgi:hypothetical protein
MMRKHIKTKHKWLEYFCYALTEASGSRTDRPFGAFDPVLAQLHHFLLVKHAKRRRMP